MDPSKIGTMMVSLNTTRIVEYGRAFLVDRATEAVPVAGIRAISNLGRTWKYPLGTDHAGRDILTRIIYGSRISVMVAPLSILYGEVIGIAFGVGAGYFGKRLEHDYL